MGNTLQIQETNKRRQKSIESLERATLAAFGQLTKPQNHMKNQNLVKKENGKIRIKPAPEGFEVDTENSIIVYKQIESKYPLSVDKIEGRNFFINSNGEVIECVHQQDINHISSQSRAEAFLALMQLVELRDAWNEIDGGKEFRHLFHNHCICIVNNGAAKLKCSNFYEVLHFRKESTRDLFLKQHKDLINTAKELL